MGTLQLSERRDWRRPSSSSPHCASSVGRPRYQAPLLLRVRDLENRRRLLGVSPTASICVFVMGSPVGTALAMYRFRGGAR
jgi:hypothetical protein